MFWENCDNDKITCVCVCVQATSAGVSGSIGGFGKRERRAIWGQYGANIWVLYGANIWVLHGANMGPIYGSYMGLIWDQYIGLIWGSTHK